MSRILKLLFFPNILRNIVPYLQYVHLSHVDVKESILKTFPINNDVDTNVF